MKDARSELVDFLNHRVFYPVLMTPRGGPQRADIERIQALIYAEIERFRNCRSAEEVVLTVKRDLDAARAMEIRSELKALKLPVLDDIRHEFEHRAQELGVRS